VLPSVAFFTGMQASVGDDQEIVVCSTASIAS